MKQSNNKTQTTEQITRILLTDISVSPFNHGRDGEPITEESVRELAESIKQHDVIQAITVRPLANGKYEIALGERRYKGSILAGKKDIPATIRELTDEQVMELQVIENLQRKNPNPLSEARGIVKMLSFSSIKYTKEDVALRLGKSVTYVYQRLKLLDMIEQFQEMFLANVITISQALKLARLDQESQTEFYEEHCSDWLSENWVIRGFNDKLENFQLDLSEALFNIKDAKLDKKAGACTKCLNNTAVTTSLFPEDSQDARCTNRPCYENKCRLQGKLLIAMAVKLKPELPLAVPKLDALKQFFASDDPFLEGKTILVEDVNYSYHNDFPVEPKREDFNDYEEDADNDQEYQEALTEYKDDVKHIMDEVTAGNYLLAILVNKHEPGNIVYLNPIDEEGQGNSSQQNGNYKPEFKAKDYQEAVKSKTLTVELIEAEKNRLITRERRSKELDQIALQESFYNALEKSDAVTSPIHPVGSNDKAVGLFLVYDTLNYYGKENFKKVMFNINDEDDTEEKSINEKLTAFFFNATDQQISVLYRLALLNKSESKTPTNECGMLLRQLVEGTPGMDAAQLVADQQQITTEREEKLAVKLATLDKQAEKLA